MGVGASPAVGRLKLGVSVLNFDLRSPSFKSWELGVGSWVLGFRCLISDFRLLLLSGVLDMGNFSDLAGIVPARATVQKGFFPRIDANFREYP